MSPSYSCTAWSRKSSTDATGAAESGGATIVVEEKLVGNPMLNRRLTHIRRLRCAAENAFPSSVTAQRLHGIAHKHCELRSLAPSQSKTARAAWLSSPAASSVS